MSKLKILFILLLALNVLVDAGTVTINSSSNTLSFKDAKIIGKGARKVESLKCIGCYTDIKTMISWKIKVTEAGKYTLKISQSISDEKAGSTYCCASVEIRQQVIFS